MNSNETWLPVAGYENLYEVSSLGRVRSLGARARVRRPQKDRYGYLNVVLCKKGERKICKVHRLVATAHVPNPSGLPIINHKNEIKSDNRAVNLEWCDYRYNATYGSLVNKIEKESREVFQYDLDGVFVGWYSSTAEAERRTGVYCGGIAGCANGKRKTQGGYQWRYEPALFLDPTGGRFNNAQSKRVYQYTLDGSFLKEWVSATEVQRQTGWDNSTIARCCTGKLKQAYGFRWFYEFQGLRINVSPDCSNRP